MWVIKKQDTDETFTLISEHNNYTVGRTSADLVLSHDNSISRSHSILRIIVIDIDKETLSIEDVGSKYGTFINENIENGIKLNQGKQQELSDGDRIRFGIFKNIWHVSHVPIISAISGLSSGDAKIMEHYMSFFGGKLVDKWDTKCTHLTMKEFRLTVKALHALVEQRPIVTLDYWRNFVDAARRGRSTLPQPNEYKPINSNDLMGHNLDCTITPARKTVFSGMTFVFMNANQLEIYGPIIIKAGGATKALKFCVPKSFLLKSNVVVLQYVPSTPSQGTQTINVIENYLETNNLRFIPEYEIGLAILHCSIEKFCNPCYKVINGLIPSTSSMGLSPNTCLFKNTEATQSNASERTELFPRSSNTAHLETQQAYKRPIIAVLTDNDDSDDDLFNFGGGPSKKTSLQDKYKSLDEELYDLFQLKKSMQTSDKVTGKKSPIKNVIFKPKPKPLPIITTRKEKTTVEGFQQKSGVQIDNSPPRSSNTAHLETQEAYKRPIIVVLTDNDDSDDDLFNFGGGPSKKTCLQDKDKSFGEELYDVRNKQQQQELCLLETEKIGVNDDGKSGSKQNSILDDESMSKRKQNKIIQIVISDSDDSNEEENLFQLKKRMQTSDKVTDKKSPIKNIISKPKPKPLPIITTRKEKTTVEGFQQKSGVQIDNSPPRSSNTAHLETQQAYKRPIIAVLTDNDDSDDKSLDEELYDLFQLKKSMQTSDKVTGKKSPIKNIIFKPKPKPLPIITTRKEKTTVEGFQQKSGVQIDNSPPRSSNTAHLETQQAFKRPIIAVLTDNDDSDDDLFNYKDKDKIT
ncbi:nibrin-like [Teleopsis dalmanni]|uniref:nibrin-like n=1 Tax=Teleopsis dalmanni TaxID=139649 RepID=UPI0018CCC911|nr:nibrin-like [Teleopsis dalmanni]